MDNIHCIFYIKEKSDIRIMTGLHSCMYFILSIINDETRIKNEAVEKCKCTWYFLQNSFYLRVFMLSQRYWKCQRNYPFTSKGCIKLSLPPHVASIVFKEHKVLLKVFFRNYFKTISILCSPITKMYHLPLNRGENNSWCRIYQRSNYRIFTREKRAYYTMKLEN